jgi:hypothetical protein
VIHDNDSNFQHLTVWAPLIIVDNTTLQYEIELHIYPPVAQFVDGKPRAFGDTHQDMYKVARRYGINETDRGIAFIIEAISTSPNGTLRSGASSHRGSVKILDPLGNAVTDVMEMTFDFTNDQTLVGTVVWDCKNTSERYVGQQMYVALIEVEIAMLSNISGIESVIRKKYRKSVGVAIGR